MFEKNANKYDPVTATIPGVDQQQRSDELKELSLSGDPQPKKETPNEKKIIFQKFGIKIVK